MNLQELEIDSLTTAERLLLVDRLLEDAFAESTRDELTEEQMMLIQERSNSFHSGMVTPIPWEAAYQQILQQLR